MNPTKKLTAREIQSIHDTSLEAATLSLLENRGWTRKIVLSRQKELWEFSSKELNRNHIVAAQLALAV